MNLYLHVPFCRGKCAYCAFYSEPEITEAAAERWLGKIAADLGSVRIGEKVETVYFGGGTPTLLPESVLRELFGILENSFDFEPDAEISMECNPGSLTQEKAKLIAGHVNRVSMGAQSFHPELLKRIGRRNSTPEDVRSTVRLLRENGIRNLGLDLICALPGETLEDWRSDLDSALELGPDHVSAYMLGLEPGTPLEKAHPEETEESLQADMWELAGEVLGKAGLPRYEISNHAAAGMECRHNQNVWHGGRYLGFGPSACSFDGRDRWTNASPLSDWLGGKPPERDSIPRRAREGEILMMGLRTVRGWRRREFDWTSFLPVLEGLREDGLVILTEETVRPSEKGLLCWNDIAERLVV